MNTMRKSTETKTGLFKKTKLSRGIYLIQDCENEWIAVNTNKDLKESQLWTAYQCNRYEDCTAMNNWGVAFDTLKKLINYSQKF